MLQTSTGKHVIGGVETVSKSSAADPGPEAEEEAFWERISVIGSILIILRRRFGGDLKTGLIFLLMQCSRTREDMPIANLCDVSRIERLPSINASELARKTGIPRETVRRKLKAMQKAGWTEQVGSSEWRLTTIAADEFASVMGEVSEQVLALARQILLRV